MDLNDIRSVVTVISFAAFVALVALTWSRSRRAGYDEAAQLPFDDDARTASQGSTGAQQ